MKRTDLKKLNLKTTTIRPLRDAALEQARGGYVVTWNNDCSMSCSNPSATQCCESLECDVSGRKWCYQDY